MGNIVFGLVLNLFESAFRRRIVIFYMRVVITGVNILYSDDSTQ